MGEMLYMICKKCGATYDFDASLPFLNRCSKCDLPTLVPYELDNLPRSLTKTSEEQQKEITALTLNNIINRPNLEIDWIIDNVIAQSSCIGLFGGMTASYKTWIGIDMCYAVATGSKFLNIFNVKKPRGVLYIDEENGIIEIQRRMKLMGLKETDNFYLTDTIGILLDDDAWLQGLHEFISLHSDIQLIFVDTYRRVISIDEDKAEEVNSFINKLKAFKKIHNVTFIFTHHFRKTQGNKNSNIELLQEFRGSSDLTNSSETIIIVQNIFGFEDNRIKISCEKLRNSVRFKPQILIVREVDNKFYFESIGEVEDKETEKQKCMIAIMGWFTDINNKEVKTKDIIEAMRKKTFNRTNIIDAIQLLNKTGEIYSRKHGLWKPVRKNEKWQETE